MFLNYKLMVVVLMGLLFISCSHPMMLVVLMVGITLFYSMYMYSMMGTCWYSFVLLLVMLSGVLVVFTYMASMTPNESFEFMSIPVMFFVVFIPFVSYGVAMQIDVWGGLSLWDSYAMVMNLYIVVYLLVVMLMVVWVSGWWFGPVRVYW